MTENKNSQWQTKMSEYARLWEAQCAEQEINRLMTEHYMETEVFIVNHPKEGKI